MPLSKIETKPAVKVLDLDCHGKKQYYKSGPNKEKPKYKIKTQAKTKSEIDWQEVQKILYAQDTIVIEEQQPRPGNGSAQCAKTMFQYGYLVGLAQSENPRQLKTIRPQKWKEDLGITLSDLDNEERKALTATERTKLLKRLSYEKAVALYPEQKKQFISPGGAIKDGRCEAVLIGYWFLIYGDKNDQN